MDLYRNDLTQEIPRGTSIRSCVTRKLNPKLITKKISKDDVKAAAIKKIFAKRNPSLFSENVDKLFAFRLIAIFS